MRRGKHELIKAKAENKMLFDLSVTYVDHQICAVLAAVNAVHSRVACRVHTKFMKYIVTEM